MSRKRQRAIARELHSSALRLLRHLRTVDKELGVSPARLSILSVLVFGGSKSVGELAEIEQVRQPTMTSLIGGLVQDGLAQVRGARNDKRVRVVSATAKGRSLLLEGRRLRESELLRLTSGIRDQDWRTLETAAGLLVSIMSGARR